MIGDIAKPAARRCATCDTNWPNTDFYAECPRGHGPTWKAADETPISTTDASTIATAYKKFAEYAAHRQAEITMLEELLV